MSKKLLKRLFLDFVMTVIMIVLMGYAVTGALWHEILGIIVLVMILIHNLINIKWYINAMKHKEKKRNYKIYLSLVINILMVISSILLGISSVIISRELFSALNIAHSQFWSSIHTISAYWELILIAVHIGFHWKMIMNVCGKLLHFTQKNTLRTLILRLLALVLALLGVKSSFDRGIGLKLLPREDNRKMTEEGYFKKEKRNQFGEGYGLGDQGEEKSLTGTVVKVGESLDNYLGRLTCTACPRQCSLLSPQCRMGEKQKEEATAYYHSNKDTAVVSPSPSVKGEEASLDNTVVKDGESIDDYLGRLTCTACPRQCSLLAPQCGMGEKQKEEATAYYHSSNDTVVVSPSPSVKGEDASLDKTVVKDGESLDAYLGRLICTACPRQCSLLAPQCGKGKKQKEEATAYYHSNKDTAVVSPSPSVKGEDANPAITAVKDGASPDDSLGSLFCTACPKHCSLLAPQCGIGEKQKVEETSYNQNNQKNTVSNKDTAVESPSPSIKGKDASLAETVVEDGESLEDYLGRLICTACPRHCSLLAPQCGKGKKQKEEATAYYQDNQKNASSNKKTAVKSQSRPSAKGKEASLDKTVVKDKETLEDYLGRLICTACPRHCSLLAPQCGKGEKQKEEATAYYQNNQKNVVSNKDTAVVSPSPSIKGEETSLDKTVVKDGETLEDYLGRLICTACPRHCSLLAPQCGKGEKQKEEATAYYQNNQKNAVSNKDTAVVSPSPSVKGEEAILAGAMVEDEESLDDFLGRLTCTACPRQCSLLAPQCGKGEKQKEEATAYYQNYQKEEGSNSDTSPDSGNKLTFEIDSDKDDSLLRLFLDYIPIMGVYIAGAYYTLEIIDKAKKK